MCWAVNVGPPSFLPPSPPSPTKPINRTHLCHDGLFNTQAQPALLRFARLQLPSSLSFGRCQSELETMNPAREIWLLRLSSAFRTALACTIVGSATLYGPPCLRHELAFPAFSYLTTILIVFDATLGDTLRGCWHAVLATIQVVPLAILSLWVIGPAHFAANVTAAIAVAVSAFMVAVPESTHLMCKRIAFGQIVVVYVGVVTHGGSEGAIKHPLRVAASTGLGALASVLALLFPVPRLAYREVRKACQQYVENALERLNLFVEAFAALSHSAALDLLSQAKSFSNTAAKLLQSIKLKQEGIVWERPEIRFLKPNYMNPRERLQNIEILIRGMDIAITSCPAFPVNMIDQDLPYVLQSVKEQICLKLRQAKCSIPFDATTAPERKGELLDSYLHTLRAVFPTQKDLPAFFFLFCIKLLQDDSCITLNPEPILENSQERNREESRDSHKRAKCSSFKRNEGSGNQRPSSERLVFAIKCSLTLGLAVLIGLIYNKEEAYWSGLTIAISFVTGRQATFTLANARAQGTVMGSVYGVLGCFIFQKFVKMRFLLLFPWIIFTSFLKHSRLYGQAGGVSAVIGALLILGRKDYGTPSEFAIARIAEAFIGLSCFITVEFILRPMRAATLAKSQLSRTLGALRECIKELALYDDQKNMPVPLLLALRAKQKKLKFNVSELEKFIGEAELEPSMWFLPFHGACYKNLFGSVSKMVDLLLFVAYKIEFLLEASEIVGVAWKELQGDLNNDLQQFKEKVGSSLKCLEEVTSIKSLAVLDKKLQKANISHDVDLGKSPHSNEFRLLSTDEEVVEKILSSFLQHSREVNEKIYATEGEEELKSQMVLVSSGLGFCINSLMSETIEIEKHVNELVKWENPSRLINLYEISSKVNALYTFNSRTTTP